MIVVWDSYFILIFCSRSLIVEEVDTFEPLQTIIELVNFVDRICVVGLELEKDNILLFHFIMDFFELVWNIYALPLILYHHWYTNSYSVKISNEIWSTDNVDADIWYNTRYWVLLNVNSTTCRQLYNKCIVYRKCL